MVEDSPFNKYEMDGDSCGSLNIDRLRWCRSHSSTDHFAETLQVHLAVTVIKAPQAAWRPRILYVIMSNGIDHLEHS